LRRSRKQFNRSFVSFSVRYTGRDLNPSFLEEVVVHLREDFRIERYWRRRRQNSIDAASRTKGSNAIGGASSLNLATVNPVHDFGWSEERLTVEATGTFAPHENLSVSARVLMNGL
jgi:hypothetical protein